MGRLISVWLCLSKSKVWYLKWRDASGRQRKKTTHSRDRVVAKRKKVELERQLAIDPLGEPMPEIDGSRTWSSVVAEFVKIRNTLRPASLDAYRYCGSAFEKVAADPPVVQITRITLERYVAARYDAKISPTTINKELRHIASILNWARKCHYIVNVPEWQTLKVREDERDPAVVPQDVFDKMLSALNTPGLALRRPVKWWRMFLQLLHWTGCRTGELLKLTWASVDFKENCLNVSASASKGRRDKSIPLTVALVNALENWRVSCGNGQLEDQIFPLDCSSRQIYVDWKRIETAAGLPHHLPKHYRSSRACKLVELGEPTLVIRDWLGHSSVTTTERYYASGKHRLPIAAENLRRHLDDSTPPDTTA